MSVRMTDSIRKTIIKNIIVSRFEDKEKQIEEEEFDLAEFVLTRAVPEKYAEQMSLLPPNFFPTANDLLIHLPGKSELPYLADTRIRFRRPVSVPYWLRYSIQSYWLEDDPELLQRVESFFKKRLSIEQEKQRLVHELNSELSQFTTTKRLLEACPEIKPHIPKEKKPAQLPVATNKLREILATP